MGIGMVGKRSAAESAADWRRRRRSARRAEFVGACSLGRVCGIAWGGCVASLVWRSKAVEARGGKKFFSGF